VLRADLFAGDSAGTRAGAPGESDYRLGHDTRDRRMGRRKSVVAPRIVDLAGQRGDPARRTLGTRSLVYGDFESSKLVRHPRSAGYVSRSHSAAQVLRQAGIEFCESEQTVQKSAELLEFPFDKRTITNMWLKPGGWNTSA